jgi:hypothetical protein
METALKSPRDCEADGAFATILLSVTLDTSSRYVFDSSCKY